MRGIRYLSSVDPKDTRQFTRDPNLVKYFPTDEEVKAMQSQSSALSGIPGFQLWFNDTLARNVFIGLMRPLHDGQNALDCRKHYDKLGYTSVKIFYQKNDNALMIMGEGTGTKDGFLYIPTHNISSIGVDTFED